MIGRKPVLLHITRSFLFHSCYSSSQEDYDKCDHSSEELKDWEDSKDPMRMWAAALLVLFLFFVGGSLMVHKVRDISQVVPHNGCSSTDPNKLAFLFNALLLCTK